MTPEQALNVLTVSTSLLQVNRQDHQTILEALKTLEDAIKSTSAADE